MGPFDQMKAWNVESVAGIYRFLTRVWNSSLRVIETNRSETEKSIKTALHKAIKKSSDDIPELRFNTTIAAFMEFLNLWEKIGSDKMSINDLELFLKILAPFAPFMTEEIWSLIGKTQSIHREKWPDYNKEMLVEDRIEVPVQINGKLRGTIVIEVQDIKDQSNAFDLAKADLNIAKYLDKEPKKIIYVPGKILNIIV